MPAAQPDDDAGKTRVARKMPHPAPEHVPAAPAASAGDASDEMKTQVAKRVTPPSVTVPPPAPKPPSQVIPPRSQSQGPHPPSQSMSGLRFRYCPNCTTPNNPDATVCARCKAPLGGPRSGAAPAKSQWPLYVAIAVAGVLAVALVLVLLMRKG
jgi:hypothetical protein